MSKFYTFASCVGNNIHVRGWDDSRGGFYMDKVPYEPTLFVPSKKETEYRTLDGIHVSPVKPGGIRDCREFIDQYTDVSGAKVYGMERFLYQYLSEEFDGEIEYDVDKIKLWSLDIETASENGFPKPEEAQEEVLLITLKNYKTKSTITFGSRPYTPKKDSCEYILCNTEEDLLNTFIAWWENTMPDVITGWNVDLFDMTYLCNRIINVFGERRLKVLSPWGLVQSKLIENRGRKQQKFEICGITVIDYLDLYKKFTYTNRESYRLEVIANIELGHTKLDHSEFNTFKDFYTKNWEKFVDYNLVDVELVDALEEKMKLIDLVMLMAYDAHVNYLDTFAQVRLWDVIIYNYLRPRNIVLPLIDQNSKSDQYTGAYVKEPVPGSYDWVVSYDLNSLYPSIIRLLNISPETLLEDKYLEANVDDMVEKKVAISTSEDVCLAANGAMYTKEFTGMMPTLVTKMYDERVAYKKQMLKLKQLQVDIESEMKRRKK